MKMISGIRALLVLQVLLKFAGAGALVGATERFAEWFDVTEDQVLTGSGILFIAGVIVALLALASLARPSLIRWLSGLNFAVGLVSWLALLFSWDAITPTGSWMLAAAGDVFIALGLAESLLSRGGDGPTEHELPRQRSPRRAPRPGS